MFLSTAPNTLRHYMELVIEKLQPVTKGNMVKEISLAVGY
jgi:hypothetical protein